MPTVPCANVERQNVILHKHSISSDAAEQIVAKHRTLGLPSQQLYHNTHQTKAVTTSGEVRSDHSSQISQLQLHILSFISTHFT